MNKYHIIIILDIYFLFLSPQFIVKSHGVGKRTQKAKQILNDAATMVKMSGSSARYETREATDDEIRMKMKYCHKTIVNLNKL